MHPVRPSLNFQDRADSKACVVESRKVQTFLNGLLALVHPSLCQAALSCQHQLHQELPDHDRYVAALWDSYFHGIAIISNGTTVTPRVKYHSMTFWYH